MRDEASWARSIAGGDRAAFERFVDTFGPRVHRLARRYAQRECDAEDLTQEIFVSLFQSLGSFRGESQLSTWVYRVALNHCLRHREQARRQVPAASTCSADQEPPEPGEAAADRESDPARLAARGEMRQQVRLSLEELSDGHREIIVLHEMHGLSYRECAQVLGIPLGTVKSRLSNAFRHLRRRLGPYVLGPEQAPAPVPNSNSTAPTSSAPTVARGEAP